jgi:hypothetical protein
MTSPGIFISSSKVSSGDIYDGTWNLTNEVQGYYNVVYTHLADGDVPICYQGINTLVVIRNSNSAQTILHFADLSSDTPATVETWLETEFVPLLADIGVTIVSATVQADGSYTCVFDLAVTLKFSSNTSTLSKIFGRTDLSGTSINLSGVNINNRPKFLGVAISECQQIFASSDASDVNLLISSADDLCKGIIIYIPSETDSLNIQVVRMNAPSVACPITLPWEIVLQRNFNAAFAG